MISTLTRLGLGLAMLATAITAGAADVAPTGPPQMTIDLATDAGEASVQGQWRYSDARIVEATFRAPDAQGQPTGRELMTNDIVPHAGGTEFDDASWQAIKPSGLADRLDPSV